MSEMKEATDFEYLMWFFANADFGPADSDVREIMEYDFMAETNKLVPKQFRERCDEVDD